MIREGEKAPGFELADSQGNTVRLKDFAGKTVILYFYPKDDTPGCTIEAREFSDLSPAFAEKDAVVFGISADTVESHDSFSCKYDLKVRLLSDPDHAAIEPYGAWQEKNRYGRRSMGIQRSTVIVGPDGTVRRVWPKVNAAGHARAVLDSI
jgi:peroxiredoxin Q/BCP